MFSNPCAELADIMLGNIISFCGSIPVRPEQPESMFLIDFTELMCNLFQ